MNLCRRACLFTVFATASIVAYAQYWEVDAAFAPVLESSTIVPNVTMLPVAGGKVLVTRTGDVDSINGVRASIVRLNPDGSTDATFALPEETALVPKAAYPDGRVLATRSVVGTGGSSAEELVRLTATGALDSSFTPARLNSGATTSARILADGRILLAGSFTAVSGNPEPLLCILNADGSVSTTFHSPLAPGQIAFGDGGGIAATPIVDGRFIVVGQFFDLGPAKLKNVARLLANGSVDPTFNANAVSFPAPVRRAYSQSDGGVLVTFGPSVMAIGAPSGVFRLTSTGARDTSFTAAIEGSYVTVGPQQSDGRIFYRSYRENPYRYEVRRLNADGTADASFTPVAAEGSLDLPMPLVGHDGSLWFGAPLTWARRGAHANITRVLTDGTIDTLFSPRVSAEGRVSAILRQTDGGLALAGLFDFVNGVKTGTSISLVRLAENGTMDPSFTATLDGYEWMDWLQRAPDGEILGVGLTRTMLDSASGATEAPGFTADPWRWISRFSANGTRVADFSVETPQYLGLTITGQISVDETGRLYCVTSDRSDRRYLMRNHPEGALDESFGPVRLSGPGLFAMMPNGDFVVTSELSGSPEGITLNRFSADRVVDATFAVDPAELPETLLALVSLPDSSVIVIGSMVAENGRTLLEYVRLNVSGEVTYRYRGRAFAGSIGLPQAEEVAGVLLDAMHDAGSAAGAHLQVRLPSALGTVCVDVDHEGRLAVLLPETSGSRLQVLRRTSLTEPSVDLAPLVLTAERVDVATVFIGGRTRLAAAGGGLFPLSFQWAKDGVPIAGATSDAFELNPAKPSDAGRYTVTISNAHGSVTSAEIDVPVYTTNTSPVFATNAQPTGQAAMAGANATLSTELWGNPLPEVSWHVDGEPLANPSVATQNGVASFKSTLTLSNLTPADVGLYVALATNNSATIASSPAIVGLRSMTKTLGAGRELRADILHPNGRTFDQVLLEGAAASITADASQVTRMSYVDLNDDIVQVEFSGAGTVSLTLAGEPGPAAPASHYIQPGVNYMKGHASIVVAGANETSHLSVFTVGRANAIDQTLFRDDVGYDGIADLAYIAILSENGKFGGLRCANASFFASKGFTGIYAPDVEFTGPVYVGDIDAFDDAEPVLVVGSAAGETQINGGNLSQTNAKPVRVSGLTQLKFVAGATSHGVALPAQANQARLEQNGADVTDQIVVGP